MEMVWRFLKKLKTELPYDPEISTAGYLSKENENTYWKKTHLYHVHCSVIYSSQVMKTTQVSANV